MTTYVLAATILFGSSSRYGAGAAAASGQVGGGGSEAGAGAGAVWVVQMTRPRMMARRAAPARRRFRGVHPGQDQ